MSQVNYSDIASRYDKNTIRSDIPPDPTLEAAAAVSWRVLDLGCGTGSYIQSQSKHHKNIEWHGLDPSPEMLHLASKKVPNAKLHLAKAEQMPFMNNYFDYVTSRFSLHHFESHDKALREVHRVLKPNGFFKIVNLAPELSDQWWIFRYFPKAKAIDEKRFLSVEQVNHAVRNLGFSLNKIEKIFRDKIPANLILEEAYNRETSELLLIDDEHYKNGIQRLRDDYSSLGSALVDWGLTIVEWTFIRHP